MADKNLTIGIKTTADTAGAEKAHVAVEKLTAEESAYNERKKQFLTAAEREVAEVARMVEGATKMTAARAKETAELNRAADAAQRLAAAQSLVVRGLTDSTQKARVAEIAYYDLGAEIRRTGAASQTLRSGVTATGTSMKNTGMLANNMSYQFQDLAVQIGSGGGAVRAFGQQLPQMIGALQMAGVVTGKAAILMGGLGAAIPIVLFGGQALIKMFHGTAESADEAAERVKKVADNLAKINHDKLDEARRAMDDTLEIAENLTAEYPKTQAAQDTYALAAISNAEKLATAQRNIAEALGLQVDHIRDLELAEARAAEKRKLEYQQEVARQNKLKEDAIKNAQEVAGAQEAIRQDIENRRVAFEDRMAKLSADRARKADAEQIGRDPLPSFNTSGSFAPVRSPERAAAEAAKARAESILADPFLEARISAGESEVKGLAKELKALERDLRLADSKAIQAANDVADTTEAVNQSLDMLADTYRADTTVAKTDALLAQQKAAAAALDESISKLTPQTEKGKQIAAEMKVLTSDHLLTIGEGLKAFTLLREMNQLLATGQEKLAAQTTSSLTLQIQTNNTLSARMTQIEGELRRQNAQFRQLSGQ